MSKPEMLLPGKPHFFKPLLPGFDDEFSIPVSFFKFLKGKECRNAVLTSSAGKLWPVKVKDGRFKEGWKEFTRHHQLHVGDFLVFRHEGDMVFHVWVFDPSSCEREYPVVSIKDEKLDIPDEDPPAKNPIPERKPKKKKQSAKASYSDPEHPFFDVKLTLYSAKKCRLHMPMDFARLHGLSNKRCKMIVEDQEGRCWPTMLWSKKSDNQIFIGCGWKNCRLANKLKAGELLRFELIRNGTKPTLKMLRLGANPKAQRNKNFDDAQAGSSSTRVPNVNATSKVSYHGNSQLKIPKEEVTKESGFMIGSYTKEWCLLHDSDKSIKEKQPRTSSKEKADPSGFQHPFFVVNMSSCRSNLYKMYVPMKFARVHLLKSRCPKIILIGKKGRSSPAKLWYKSDGSVYITNGWGAFRAANDIKTGDSFALELITNGKKPVLRMHENAKIEQWDVDYKVAQAGSSSSNYPHIFAIMRPSYVKFCQLRIPTPFARRYNLGTKCADVTLVDEKGSLWSVSLVTKNGDDIYIGYGWSEFAEANNFRERDVLMIELIQEGKKPAMRISGVKQGTETYRKYCMESCQKRSLYNWEDVKPIIDGANQVARI